MTTLWILYLVPMAISLWYAVRCVRRDGADVGTLLSMMVGCFVPIINFVPAVAFMVNESPDILSKQVFKGKRNHG